MRALYVAALHAIGRLLTITGLIKPLDTWAGRSRRGLWVRSLLAIYDPIDLIALDVPWWTFEAGDLVEGHLAAHPEARVFEWGAGASTIWLGKRAGTVHSVEHDASWAQALETLVPENAVVTAVAPTPATATTVVRSQKKGFDGLDFTAYVEAIGNTAGAFEVIVIDGRARESCLIAALPRLAEDGVIVFDNVDRQRYRDALAGLDDDWAITWTRGLTPCLPYPTRTALIRRRRFSTA